MSLCLAIAFVTTPITFYYAFFLCAGMHKHLLLVHLLYANYVLIGNGTSMLKPSLPVLYLIPLASIYVVVSKVNKIYFYEDHSL